jgi:hypothetical protein
MRARVLRWGTLKWAAIVLVALLVAIQFVPYGRDHENGVVTAEPAWDSPATRDLAEQACFDCHSNETIWPWYSNIAPVSWLIQHDVDEGRHVLNFSEWDQPQETDEVAEVVREGEMPPVYYTWLHRDAKLTDAETEALIQGFLATFGGATLGPDTGTSPN